MIKIRINIKRKPVQLLAAQGNGLKVRQGNFEWIELFEEYGKPRPRRLDVQAEFPDFPWQDSAAVYLSNGYGKRAAEVTQQLSQKIKNADRFDWRTRKI